MPVTGWLALGAIMTAAAVAAADPCPTRSAATSARSPEEVATAKSLFTKGLTLQGQGKADEACKMFESSMNLDPQIGTRLNVAECRELRGQLLEAHAIFSDALEEARRVNDRRVSFASARVTALEAKLVQVTVRVAEPQPPGLAITVATCPLLAAQLAEPRFVMAGKVVVEASAAGHKPARIERDAVPGDQLAIEVPALVPYQNQEEERRAKEAEALAAVERRKAEQLRTDRELGQRYDRHPARFWGLLAGGVGVAALGAGAYFALDARRKQSTFDDLGCGERDVLLDQPTYNRCVEVRADGSRSALVGNVVLASGGALLVTGLILLVVDPGNVERPSQQPRVSVTPSTITLAVSW